MTKIHLHGATSLAVLALATLAVPASAQSAPADDAAAETPAKEIVVTGSLIRGSSEEAPVPIDVITSEELARQGSPSVIDLIKNLPTSNGIIGDANQFDARAQGNEGIASVNLRGLGPQRTLVLLNGKRIVTSGGGVGIVDVNLIPSAAIGRVEVLKDGAAATYGSDAIAGVVNFITKTNQNGFLASGDYRYIRGSKGDYGGALSYGTSIDGARFFVSAGYQHRSELRTTDRDFTIQPFTNSPQGGYTGGGNPGNFDFNGFAPFTDPATGTVFGAVNFIRDLGCAPLGGFRSLPGSFTANANGTTTPNDRCFSNFAQFDNLVEPENRFQIYADTQFDLTDRINLRVQGLWGHTETRITTSPTYLPTLAPSANAAFGGAGFFQIPTYAPALKDYCAVFGAAAGCSVDALGNPTQPALAFPVLFRPALLGGNPLFRGIDGNDRGSAVSNRVSDEFFVSGELNFELGNDLNLNTGVTYSEYHRTVDGTDTFGDLLQNALAGFGGPNCALASTSSRVGLTAAQLALLAGKNGCTFFNPFSTAVQSNPVTGQVNPNFAGSRPTNGLSTTPGAGLLNDLATFDTFFQRSLRTTYVTRQLVGDIVLSGKSGIELPGGSLGFAVGAQYRKNYYTRLNSPVNNLAFFPCPGTPLNPAATCSPQTGALGFLGTNFSNTARDNVKAVFAELQLPVFDALELQLAARYEDYGGAVGSTFNPQARAKFQLTPWLAIRGGAGSTFRGPPAQNLSGNATTLQVIGSSFRAVDINGNPDLAPEKAKTYSAGVIVDTGGLKASVDYFRYDFTGPIEGEPVQGIVTALFGATGSANCGNAAYMLLQQRFTFTAAGCGIGNVTRLRTQAINSANVSTSGIDFQASFSQDLGSVRATIGGSGTYVINYKVKDITVEGIVVQPAFDAVGLLNYQTSAYPLPRLKGSAYVEGDFGASSLRFQVNHIAGYTDQRGAGTFGPNNSGLAGASVTTGKDIRAFDTVDGTFRTVLGTGTTLSLSVLNIFDKDPPFARLDFNYDPFTATPLGRNVKLAISQKF
ncbi:MAG TPA: TonB-dependent receptor [Novosphingobium sp.]|nr:TonB-dependent receptor [Novosphingobium sp.]